MKTTGNRPLKSILVRRFFGRLVLHVLVYTGILVLLAFGGILVSSLITWQPYDPLYQLLSMVKDFFLPFFAAIWLGGVLVILLRQWNRVVESILALYGAVGKIAAGSETFINLPPDIVELQEPLRRAQYKSLRNARNAAEAEQRKNDLVVYLAHDLKTPLTSVIGYLELLRDEADIPPALRQKYLAIATTKALRLEDLINEFFEITRFSMHGLVLEPAKINLTRMLEQLSSEFLPLLQEKQLTLETDLAPDLEMSADPGKLERVVDNLLRNAVSYSYPDSAILLAARREEEGVLLTVQNRGDTIPEHKRTRIFEQFYRLDTARSSGGGAGLGLAIAKEIVELHGGAIGVESGEGLTTFTVALPNAPRLEEGGAAVAAPVVAAALPAGEGKI